MTKNPADRLSYFVIAIGLIAVLGVYGAMGASAARSTGVGVCVGLANWYLLRFIVGRLVAGAGQKSQMGAAMLLVIKMGLLLGGIFALLRSDLVEIIPFTVGVSTLVVGVLVGGLYQSLLAPRTAENER